MPLIPFARQSKSNEAGYSGERLKNLFMRPTDGYSQAALIGRGGLLEKFDLGGSVRAVTRRKGVLYAVSNSRVYRITDSGATTAGIVPDDPFTQMASNGDQIAIVADGRYFICDGGSTAEYSTGAVTDPIGVAHIDGYFVVIGSSGGRGDALTVSALDDGTTFDALDFAFAENDADDLVAVIEDHGELWLFGAAETEIWYNSGAASFPFQRNAGALIERGCLRGTPAKDDNAVFWIGEDFRAYRSGGSTPIVISTREVEESLQGGTVTGAFIADSRGHKFYVVRMQGRPAWAYDLTTQAWCEFSTGIGEAEFAATCSVRIGKVFYVGTSGGQIATIDPDTYEDIGDTLEAEAVSVPVAEADFFTIDRVHIDVASGDVNAQGDAMLQVSRDGRTWGNERWRTMGGLGEFHRRVAWHGLGTGRRFQFRVKITAPVKRDIYGAKYNA